MRDNWTIHRMEEAAKEVGLTAVYQEKPEDRTSHSSWDYWTISHKDREVFKTDAYREASAFIRGWKTAAMQVFFK